MPTNFGPTNIPVLEAWQLKTPVIYSNVRGCKEQLGDAGLLANPSKPQEWAAAMIRLSRSPKLRQSLINKGTKRLKLWTEQDFRNRVSEMIQDYYKRQVIQ